MSLSRAHFEQLYQGDADPWRFTTSDYERRKYAATLAALPEGPILSAFEPGCSIGVFTAALAPRCDALLAADIAETPLIQARARCAEFPHVAIRRLRIPEEWPDARFDLIILSEILYFLTIPEIRRTARRVTDSLAPGGALLSVHWTGENDGACSGDEAVQIFLAEAGPALAPAIQDRTQDYRLDRLTRQP